MSSIPSNETPIAVVGMGCRMPGADSLDDYWELIHQGRSGIIELPPSKIDCDLYYDPEPGKLGRSYTKLGGVVFDRPLRPEICQLPEQLQSSADSAHLIMCEVAAMAFRHAGYDPHNLPVRNTGVYIGHSGGSELAGEVACHMYTEEVVQFLREDARFQAFAPEMQQAILQGVIDRVHRTTASRRIDGGPEVGASNVSALIAQAFNLSGPALATDAACASSLIAMAMGIQALRQGHIDMAVVGGASCSKWYALVLFSQAKSISGTGSRPFDANADGLISSDGYAAVVLKTLPRALADGDEVHAVIRGIGVSSDGRGKSLWAPRKEGQILAVNRAYGRHIDPAWLQYIECHATSTQVGDSTELSALTMGLKGRLPTNRKLPIGSVKANIGHTLESAGIAGFLKAALCMKKREIPGQINYHTPNPDVPWNDIPFYVPKEAYPWPEPEAGRPRRTAVNAFGIGGLNVHVVMDDRIVESTRTQSLVPSALESSFPATVQTDDDRAIAIVGVSAVLPGALTFEAFWELLQSGRDPKVDVPPGRWSPEIYYDPTATGLGRTHNKRGGFVTDFVYDWKKHKVPPKQIANANPLQFMLLDAADQALRDAGYDQKPFDRQRACVIVGSVFGGDFSCNLQMGLRIPEFQKHIRDELRERGVKESDVEALANSYQDLLLKHMPALLDETGSFTASTLASRLTKTFDMMGGAFSLDSNDVSSLAAIAAGMGMLQDGAADLVMCAAGQRTMDMNVYEGFQLRNNLAAGDPKPAFAADGDGIVPGEGAGVLILKRLSDARRDGDRIRGIIRGMGVALNVQDHEQGYRESLQRAIANVGIPSTAISIVETASLGSRETDAQEVRALTAVLSGDKRPTPVVISSATSQVGHTLGVSGMVSVLKATAELERGMVPAVSGLRETIPELSRSNSTVQPAISASPVYATLESGRTIAAVTNSAPNGSVYTMLIEGGNGLKSPPVSAAPTTTPVVTHVKAPAIAHPTTTVRLFASGRDRLVEFFQTSADRAESLFSSAGEPWPENRQGVRIAIVTDSPESLGKQLHFASEQLARHGSSFLLDDKGIYLRETSSGRGKIAFLFPGQGSQYAGMLQPLVTQVPEAKSLLAEMDDVLRESGCPTFSEFAWQSPERMGADVFVTQLAMLVGNLLTYRLLEARGIRPDVISCHSYGEFPALVAAGVMTLRDAIQATRERTRSVESRESTRGSLLSTTAPLDVVEKFLNQLTLGAYLASHNAPDQTVIGGTADAVQGMKRLLESEGFATRTLAVPRPYHTPLLADAQPVFAQALTEIPMHAPRIPIISSVSLQKVTSGDIARGNLVNQLTTPVRYVQLVQQLAADGVTIFVEVGPNRVLSRLNQRILAGQSVSILPTDLPQQPGSEGFRRLEALLDAAGQLRSSPSASPVTDNILFFDATQARRKNGVRPTVPSSSQLPKVEAPATSETASSIISAPQVPQVAQPVTVAAPRLDRAVVTKFVVTYVVDQTGYPEEMVELTADLEADLGIDSIKKAQLIGELAENFELTHLSESLTELSLDDFRTLDSILDFVTRAPGQATEQVAQVTSRTVVETTLVAPPQPESTALVATSSSQLAHQAPVQSAALDRDVVTKFVVTYVVDQTGYPEDMVELTADLEADLGIDSIKKAQLIGELAENFELTHLSESLTELSLDDFRTLDSILDFVTRAPGQASEREIPATPATVVESTPVPQLQPEPATHVAPASSKTIDLTPTTAAASTLDRDVVTKFVVTYVVDQTGYPEDMVELTADLEADLGIDSIKKAQLIGELAENFELTHLSESLTELSLDDFRTLDSILDFVTRAPGVAQTSNLAVEAPVTTAIAEPSAPLATTTVESTVSEQPLASGKAIDRDVVTKFVVTYVVDQTGYPEDMVELTADLEADLGIDSIKKAQLIGELAENFELTHLSESLTELSLDDFRTLDSILDFVTRAPGQATSISQDTVTATTQSLPTAEAEVPIQAVGSSSSQPESRTQPEGSTPGVVELPDAFSVVPVQGSPYDMGFQHGRSQGPAIRAIMERYAAMLGPRLQNMPELDEALAKPTMYFGETEIEELRGVADGADLHPAAVLAHNLGMYPDYVPGCTQFAFTRSSNPKYGIIHAVNEDSPLSLTLPDCLSRIVQIRRPAGKIAHITFSVAGQAGGLNGINAAGLAITSTLLLDCPRRKETAIGKVHPVIVKRLLEEAGTIDDAVRLLRTLDRAGAWSLCLSEFATDRLCYLEYDGEGLEIQEQPRTVLTTNHCLLQTPVADVPQHSRHRLARLQQLMAHADQEGVTLELAQHTLRDRFDLGRGRETAHATMNTIRRVDNQISIVMRPELGELYVTPGPRSGEMIDTYFRLDVKSLLEAPAAKTPDSSRNGQEKTRLTTAVETVSRNGADKPRPEPVIDYRAGLPHESQRIVQRHVMRIAESPLPADAAAAPQWSGAVLILGQNKLTDALVAQLKITGTVVHVLPSDDSAVAAVEAHWQAGPAPHLFVTTAREDASYQLGQGDWSVRSKAGVLIPFLVCQKWAQLVQQAKLTSSATLIGATAMGGDFGFSGRITSFEGGGITGLFKGLRRELADMRVKVIDAPLEESPDALAKVVLREAAQTSGPLEIGSIRGRRYQVQAVPLPASTQRARKKAPSGSWIVTGGARGVTAVVARELGRRFGLTMHLLGSTPEPSIDPSWRNLTDEGMKTLKRSILDQARAAGKNPANTWKDVERSIEIDRTLQSFRADGITVRYHACNVADRKALETTLNAIRQQDGPIHGVIHGAGLEAACRFDKKKRELVQATLAVKVDAAIQLVELLANDPLEYLIGFGSTSGRFGGMGQSDYSMASDMLCKFCDALRAAHPHISATGLHWPPWADVGMAARPESKIALQSSNLAFMPPLEGAAHVIDELLNESGEGEVLFLDKPDMIDTDGTMPSAELKREYARRDELVKSAAIIDSIHNLKSPGSLTAQAKFDPTSDPFLIEHRHQGQPLLPAVVAMESMAEATTILAANGEKVVGLRNLVIHQGLRFHNDRAQLARVQAERTNDGAKCRLEANFCDRLGRLVEANRLQVEAHIELASTYPTLSPLDLGPIPREWTTHKYVADWRTMKFPEEARVYHGYPFRTVRDYAIVEDGIWARLVVPPQSEIAGTRNDAGWQLPSATLDGGLLAVDLLVWNTLHVADLPQGFDHIQFGRPLVPGESLTMRAWLRDRSERTIRADFVMLDAAARVVMRVDGFEMVEVKTGTAPTTAAASSNRLSPPADVRQDQNKETTPAPQRELVPNGSSPAPARLPEAAPRRSQLALNGANGHAPAPAPLPSRMGATVATTLETPTPQARTSHPALTADRLAELPMIDAARWESDERLIADMRLDPRTDPFLDEHRFSGKPLLPAVIGLESMIEAASLTEQTGLAPVVRDFQVMGPCKFLNDEPKQVKVVVERAKSGWTCRLMSTGPNEQVYQSATVEFVAPGTALQAPPPDKSGFPYNPMQYASKGQAQLVHGPRFQCLKGLSLMREWGWGKIKAAAANNLAGPRQGTRWFLPVAALDSCLVACGVDLFILMNMRVEIPQQCDELRIGRLPEADEICMLKLQYQGHNERSTTYDLYLYGANQEVLLTLKGYRGIKTSKGADAALWDGDFREDS